MDLTSGPHQLPLPEHQLPLPEHQMQEQDILMSRLHQHQKEEAPFR